MQKWVIGIDEAGRGPLAGPVSVGVACVPHDFDWDLIQGVNDSKKLTPKKREEIYTVAESLKKANKLSFAVTMVSAHIIDKIGIVPSIKKAMGKSLDGLPLAAEEYMVKLDGGLQAPERFVYQETIVKGDSKEKVIGLASIVAKVARDRYMMRISAEPKFASYTFETHKGYGTKKHCEAIRQFGLSDIHRKTFCRNLL